MTYDRAAAMAALSHAGLGSFQEIVKLIRSILTGTTTLDRVRHEAAVTATADGTGTGVVPEGATFVTVTSAGANDIVTLPAPIPGTIVRLINGATGYELRTTAPATVAINGGAAANAESAIAATTLVTCVCTTPTTWIAMSQVAAGTITATQVAAA